MKVCFLPKPHIEASAIRLITEYGRRFDKVDHPPIPVEEILEALLGLNMDFDDLTARLGVPDVLGATWVNEKQVLIDQSLDPTINPTIEGRYRFTVAHEVGHWELHRHLFQNEVVQSSLFDKKSKPSIVCRSQSRKDPMEWQADTFSGYLLMPKDMVFSAWESHHGVLEPYVAVDEIEELTEMWGLDVTGRIKTGIRGPG